MTRLVFIVFGSCIFSFRIMSQLNIPHSIEIRMIGATGKPIDDLIIVDSINNTDNKFYVRSSAVYANYEVLNKIYSIFVKEVPYDSLIYRDYSFGTFLFVFHFKNINSVEIIANPTNSKLLLQNIITNLSIQTNIETIIIKKLEIILSRINLSQREWDFSKKLNRSDFNNDSSTIKRTSSYSLSKIEIDYNLFDTCIFFNVKSVFICNKSWFTDTSSIDLRNDQANFDITEIFARKIRKLLLTNLYLKKSKLFIKNEIRSIKNDYYKYKLKFSKKTKDSKKVKAQLRWEKKIQSELSALRQFDQPVFSNCH